MDCGIVVTETPQGPTARTIPMCDVAAGESIVCGASGIRVLPLPQMAEAARGAGQFEFMSSEVSSEKPQALLVRQVADQMREVEAHVAAFSDSRGTGTVNRRHGPRYVEAPASVRSPFRTEEPVMTLTANRGTR
jgi:hypothetical protein